MFLRHICPMALTMGIQQASPGKAVITPQRRCLPCAAGLPPSPWEIVRKYHYHLCRHRYQIAALDLNLSLIARATSERIRNCLYGADAYVAHNIGFVPDVLVFSYQSTRYEVISFPYPPIF